MQTDRSPHLLGISLEDYFQVGAFSGLVDRKHWGRFESRLEQSTRATLSLLATHGARATFFTLGWVAEHMPELVRDVADAGHEIANAGFAHRGAAELDAAGLADELARGHDAIVRATGHAPLGTRIPDFLRPGQEWAWDVVAAAGYAYDASFRPLGVDRLAPGSAHEPFAWQTRHGELQVFPVPALRAGPLQLPIGGGAWLRQLPWPLVRRAIDRHARGHAHPFALYFQVWELDPEQPRIRAASRLSHWRHYRNLGDGRRRLDHLLGTLRFTSYAAHLGLAPAAATSARAHPERGAPALASHDRATATPVSVVIPCFNEAESIPFLLNTLASVQQELSSHWRLTFVFVDDGSADGTWEVLQRLVGQRADCRLVQHARNRGIAHAILTGLGAAPDELACSIDADCTYDPHQIAALLPPLLDGATLVTASPYHPAGRVRHVPGWRLVLSRTLSRLYRHTLGTSLHTYTSCFRAYRRSAFLGMPLEHGGFLGIAEMLARTVRTGARVEEVPATLEVRLLGHSKLKVLRVIWGHLGLLARLQRQRGGAPDHATALPAPLS